MALAIVPALSTVEGPPLVEPPLALIERPVKSPVIVAPTESTTVEPPPIKAPLEPAVIIPEFVGVNETSPADGLPPAVTVPWLVTAQPGLATEVTPTPGAASVAPLTTVPLMTPGSVAQPAVPRTMGPFAPMMIPLASQVACAELPRASNAIASITARPAVGMTAATSCASAPLARTLRARPSPRQDAAHRVRSTRNCGRPYQGLGKPELFDFLGFSVLQRQIEKGEA